MTPIPAGAGDSALHRRPSVPFEDARVRGSRGRARVRGAVPVLMLLLSAVWMAVARAGPTELRLPGEAGKLTEMAARGTNVARLFDLGDLCHDAGAAGDKAAVVRAESYLREALRLEPTNAPALALLGSVYTMKGRDAFWPTQQLRWVRDGNDLMDQAVKAAPLDIRTRLIRVFNNAHMPDFLGRTEIVRADLAWLWEKTEKEPDHFTVSQRQQLALHWGRQLKRQHRTDQARSVWEQGRALTTNSPLAGELTAELSKLR